MPVLVYYWWRCKLLSSFVGRLPACKCQARFRQGSRQGRKVRATTAYRPAPTSTPKIGHHDFLPHKNEPPTSLRTYPPAHPAYGLCSSFGLHRAAQGLRLCEQLSDQFGTAFGGQLIDQFVATGARRWRLVGWTCATVCEVHGNDGAGICT